MKVPVAFYSGQLDPPTSFLSTRFKVRRLIQLASRETPVERSPCPSARGSGCWQRSAGPTPHQKNGSLPGSHGPTSQRSWMVSRLAQPLFSREPMRSPAQPSNVVALLRAATTALSPHIESAVAGQFIGSQASLHINPVATPVSSVQRRRAGWVQQQPPTRASRETTIASQMTLIGTWLLVATRSPVSSRRR